MDKSEIDVLDKFIRGFWVLPKVFLTHKDFKSLSMNAVVLYAILLELHRLSRLNGWRDEDGEIYVQFSIESVKKFLSCTHPTAIKTLRELDDERGLGLIHIKRQRLGRANLIYLNKVEGLETFVGEGYKDSLGVKKLKTSNILNKEVKNLSSKPVKNLSSNNKNMNNNMNKKASPSPAHIKIIDYLNTRTGKHFKATSKDAHDLIEKRLAEGYKVKDFIKVIDTKAKEWEDDKKMKNFLRPSTLFGPKFETYLNQGRTYGLSKKAKARKLEGKEKDFAIDTMFEKLDQLGVFND